MPHDAPRNRTAALLFAFLMTATVVSITNASASPVSTAQDAAIQSPPPAGVGPGAPFGPWVYGRESVNFYLHGQSQGSAALAQCAGTPASQIMNLQLPPPANTAVASTAAPVEKCTQLPIWPDVTGGGGSFDPAGSWNVGLGSTVNYFGTYNLTHIFAINLKVYGQGSGQYSAIRARVWDVDDSAGGAPALTSDYFDPPPNRAPAQPIATIMLIPYNTGAAHTVNKQSEGTIPYIGSTPQNQWGVYGYPLLPNHSLLVELMSVQSYCPVGLRDTAVDNVGYCAGQPINLWFDSSGAVGYPSVLQIESDSARASMWTENEFGQPATNFQAAQSATIASRVVQMHAVVADMWGNLEGIGCTGTSSSPAQPANACPRDQLDENKWQLRVRDVTASHTQPNGFCAPGNAAGNPNAAYQAPSPSKLCDNQFIGIDQGYGLNGNDPGIGDSFLGCCNSQTTQNLVLYTASKQELPLGLAEFSYQFHYRDNVPPGDYRMEFADSVNGALFGWSAYATFHIGVSGFSLQYAPFESTVSANGTEAYHSVSLSQPTDYVVRITNNGADTDVYGLSVDTPGQGWTGEVEPSSISLAPGAFGDVTLHVTPPVTGRSGDVQVVDITAVSLNDNSHKTLYSLTTLTAQEQHGVKLSTEKLAILTRPLVTTVFPIHIRNTGTREDQFVLSTDGMPPGWEAYVTPALEDIYAASFQSALVTVRAPADAVPDSSFTLTITAQDTQGIGLADHLSIPVKVFVIAGVDVTGLGTGGTDCPHGTWPAVGPAGPDIICSIVFRDPAGDYFPPCQENAAGTTSCSNANTGALSGQPVQDTRADNGPLYRVRFTNSGDTADKYTITGSWVPVLGDHPDCEALTSDGQFDGVPDGWRLNVLNDHNVDPLGRITLTNSAVFPGNAAGEVLVPGPQVGSSADGQRVSTGAASAFSGEMQVAVLSLPAHQSQDVFFDMYWDPAVKQGGDANGDNYANPISDGCDGTVNRDPDWRIGPNAAPWSACNQYFSQVSIGNVPPKYGTNPTGTNTGNCWNLIEGAEAAFRVSYRSQDDGTIRGYAYLDSKVADKATSTGTDARGQALDSSLVAKNTAYGTAIEMGIDRATGIQDTPNEFTPAGGTKYYNLIATNAGNSLDSLKVKLRSNANGWIHQIHIVPIASTNPVTPMIVQSYFEDSPTAGSPTRGSPSDATYRTNSAQPVCQVRVILATGDQSEMTCDNMGVFDQVLFQVAISPPLTPGTDPTTGLPYPAAQVGDTDVTSVIVSSDQGDNVAQLPFESDQTLTTTVQGAYAFRLLTNPPQIAGSATSATRSIEPGQTRAFPFTIQNIGTASDTYLITLAEGNKTWSPRVESVNTVVVPGGLSYHGFLQVTAPTTGNVTIGNTEHFRIIVRSLAASTVTGQPGQTALMDMFANIVANHACQLTTELVTIPPLGQDRSQVSTQCPADGSRTFVEFIVNRTILPAGWAFVCLPASHPRFDPNCPPGTAPDTGKAIKDDRQLAGDGKATGDMAFSVPGNELAASRVAVEVLARYDSDPTDTEATDIIVNVKSTYGLNLTVVDPLNPGNPDPAHKVFPPGVLNAFGLGVPITITNYTLRVENTGLSTQSVIMTSTAPPCTDPTNGSSCWKIHFTPSIFTLSPGDHRDVEADIEIPVDAPAGTAGVIQVCATVTVDATQNSCRILRPEVGRYGVKIDPVTPVDLAPQETAHFAITVRNTGTVDDYIFVQAQIGLPGLGAPVTWTTATNGTGGDGQCDSYNPTLHTGNPFAQHPQAGVCWIFLKACTPDMLQCPGRRVDLQMQLPPSVMNPAPTALGQSQANIPIAIIAQSKLSTTKLVLGSTNAQVQILDYVAADVDADGLPEYAIDRNKNPADGYEQFRENLIAGGVVTRAVSLCNFLLPDVRAQKCPNNATTYFVDGDGDGKADFFLDTNGGGLPTVYFHPDKLCTGNTVQNLTLALDVIDHPGETTPLPEYFLDLGSLDGSSCPDGRLDHWFDLATGTFGKLIPTYADSDNYLDYVVDLNGNGVMDFGEPVIFGGPAGGVSKIQLYADMNGDGKLDTVIFVPGAKQNACAPTKDNPKFICPGIEPQTFIPNGNTTSIAICLVDVTGDGVADWTYDSHGRDCHNSDVKADSYYDPVTHEAGYIHPESVLWHNVIKYWYVGALFVVVLALFVILVVVTRKR
ncbi:MAG: hypothetical protein ACYDBQ_05820 [Thermoplasmatota archaeon]